MGIEIKESSDGINFKSEEKFDEPSLVEDYRRENLAIKIQEHIIEKTPEVIAGMNIHIQLTQESIKMNSAKQKQIKEVFDKLEINVPKRIEKLRDKYSMEELLKKATEKIVNTQSSITALREEDGIYVVENKIEQSVEDLLLELMGLQDAMPGLIEKSIQQLKSVEAKNEQVIKAKSIIESKQEKLDAIADFFSKKGKDINKLLDQYAQSRTKNEKKAESLPAA